MATEPNISLNVITNDNVTTLGSRSGGKADPAVVDVEASPGAMLQQAREGKDISRDEISDRLRLQPWIVEALENDDYTKMAAPTYVRGYLRNYASFLDLPVATVLARYDERRADKPAASAIAKKTVKAGATAADNDGPSNYAPAIGFVLLLGLVGLFVAWSVGLPQESADERLAGFGAPQSDGTVISDAPVGEVALTNRGEANSPFSAAGQESTGSTQPELAAEELGGLDAAAVDAASDGELEAAASGMSADELAAAEAEAAFEKALAGDDFAGSTSAASSDSESFSASADPVAFSGDGEAGPASFDSEGDNSVATSASNDPSTLSDELPLASFVDTADVIAGENSSSFDDNPSQGQSQDVGYYDYSSPAASSDGMTGLSLYFQQDSWAEVRDSRGKQLVYRLGESGSLSEVRGVPPFRVFLGNSPGVEVQLDGAAYDTTRYVRPNNTARFQIGADS